MWPWRGTWKQVPQCCSSWTQSLKPYGQSFCQGAFVLTVLHGSIPWLMYNNTIIKKMLCGKVYPKWILIVQEFDDLSSVMSVELLSLCWSLVLKSTDVNLGSASLISAHTQGTFRMGHSIIHSILISTAALVHRTGTCISTPSMALPPRSIQIVSSASWLSVISTYKGIPKIKCKLWPKTWTWHCLTITYRVMKSTKS